MAFMAQRPAAGKAVPIPGKAAALKGTVLSGKSAGRTAKGRAASS